MTNFELLQTQAFKKKMENKIVAHITHEYSKAGLNLPLPKFREDMVTYDEPSAAKMANRGLGELVGAVLLAQALDEMEAT